MCYSFPSRIHKEPLYRIIQHLSVSSPCRSVCEKLPVESFTVINGDRDNRSFIRRSFSLSLSHWGSILTPVISQMWDVSLLPHTPQTSWKHQVFSSLRNSRFLIFIMVKEHSLTRKISWRMTSWEEKQV